MRVFLLLLRPLRDKAKAADRYKTDPSYILDIPPTFDIHAYSFDYYERLNFTLTHII